MKWIKASDRLPEGKIIRNFRTMVVYDNAGINGYGEDMMYYEGINDDLYIPIAELEWLDETADPAEVLVKALEEIKKSKSQYDAFQIANAALEQYKKATNGK